jgi:hypothetical protein
MAQRNDEMDLGPALAGMFAALSEAAGYAGGGLRSTGLRAGRVGARMSRRTWDSARRTGQRAPVAYRVFRGAEPPTVIRRRPLEFLGIAAAGGATGAIAVLAIQRYRARAAAEEARAEEAWADEPRTGESRADASTPAADGPGDGTAAPADPAKAGDGTAARPDSSVARITDRQEARTTGRTTARTTARTTTR